LDVTPEELPENDQEFAFTFTMNDVQADENAHERKKYIDVEDLKAMAISSGEGLSLSTVEENKYIYRGANPDNYIMLGEDMYRMISIEPDNTVKVVKNSSIGMILFDAGKRKPDGVTTTRNQPSGTTDYFCNKIVTGYGYIGCNAWGSSSTTLNENGTHVSTAGRQALPDTDAYLNIYLNGGTYYEVTLPGWYSTLPADVKNVIVEHLFNIGLPLSEKTLSENISDEKLYQWMGKIAIMSATDYAQANSDIDNCGNVSKSSRIGRIIDNCKDTNWLKNHARSVLVSGVSNVISSGHLYMILEQYIDDSYKPDTDYETYPSFYLTSSLKLTGEGTESNPYQLYQPSH
ncbi:MAG: hypothetical protein J6X28_05645, partial [Bacilli bacterium]|nr:hypothetical protein [Bacilli bacterium]